jgi:C-terminal processing protease CtpA/Prc
MALKLDETRDSFGFWFSFRVEEQCLYINFLIERSSAWDVGLKIGDKIVAVNGKKVLPLTSEDYCRYFFRPELLLGEGAVLDLEIDRDGKRMNFTLEKRNLFN